MGGVQMINWLEIQGQKAGYEINFKKDTKLLYIPIAFREFLGTHVNFGYDDEANTVLIQNVEKGGRKITPGRLGSGLIAVNGYLRDWIRNYNIVGRYRFVFNNKKNYWVGTKVVKK